MTAKVTLTASPPVMVLWFRQDKHHRWEAVHSGTGVECTAAIGTGSKRNGDWLTVPAGHDPNLARRAR